MLDIETIRFLDQAEMEFYLNEDSEKRIKKENKKKFSAALIILGLIAGSVEMGTHLYLKQNLYHNSKLDSVMKKSEK